MSQSAAILRDLRKGKKLTPLDGLERYNCYRLGARIYELRKAGHPIIREMVEGDNGKRYARYSMVKS